MKSAPLAATPRRRKTPPRPRSGWPRLERVASFHAVALVWFSLRSVFVCSRSPAVPLAHLPAPCSVAAGQRGASRLLRRRFPSRHAPLPRGQGSGFARSLLWPAARRSSSDSSASLSLQPLRWRAVVRRCTVSRRRPRPSHPLHLPLRGLFALPAPQRTTPRRSEFFEQGAGRRTERSREEKNHAPLPPLLFPVSSPTPIFLNKECFINLTPVGNQAAPRISLAKLHEHSLTLSATYRHPRLAEGKSTNGRFRL